MKKHLIFFVLLLSAFSIHAEGVQLTCSPYQPTCTNCPEYQTLFPIEEFSKDSGSLDIEADHSEILNETYHLTGDVKVKIWPNHKKTSTLHILLDQTKY